MGDNNISSATSKDGFNAKGDDPSAHYILPGVFCFIKNMLFCQVSLCRKSGLAVLSSISVSKEFVCYIVRYIFYQETNRQSLTS